MKAKPKQPFLKRGEGLARFTSGQSQSQGGRGSRRGVDQRDWPVCGPERQRVQRKTAPGSSTPCAESPPARGSGKARAGSGPAVPGQKPELPKRNGAKGPCASGRTGPAGRTQDGRPRERIGAARRAGSEGKENAPEGPGPRRAGRRGWSRTPGTDRCPPGPGSRAAARSPGGETLKEAGSSLDTSAQNWEREKEKENLELDEFLFLEQAADEISFSSNSSFVLKILERDRQGPSGRRLSSTPVKAVQQPAATALRPTGQCDPREGPGQAEREGAGAGAATPSQLPSGPSPDWLRAQSGSVSGSHTCDGGTASTDSSTDSEEPLDVTVKPSAEDSTGASGSREDSPQVCGGKGPFRDAGTREEPRDADLDLSEKDYSSDESVLTESLENKGSESCRRPSSLGTSRIDFDDERTWTDLEENSLRPGALPGSEAACPTPQIAHPCESDTCDSDTCALDRTMKRKVAAGRREGGSPSGGGTGPPPTAGLTMKFFPALRPKPDSRCGNERKSVSQDQPPGKSGSIKSVSECCEFNTYWIGVSPDKSC